MIKLSFILPCYNVAPYVGRCIESIETQDIPQVEYEVICVDDCSKDNTVEVIKEYQKQYPNIRLICHTENKTAGGARNTGIVAAKGEYLWFVDPDDAIVPDKTIKLYEYAKEQNVDILIFNFSICEDGRNFLERNQITSNTEILPGQDFFIRYFPIKRMADVASVWRQLYKRSFCNDKSLRYPEIKAAQDVVFAWNAFMKAERIVAIPDNGYICYRRPTSTTGSKGRFAAKAIISQSLLFANEIYQLERNTEDIHPSIRKDLDTAIRYALNVDIHNLLHTTRKEQYAFYKTMQQNHDKIDCLQSYMNRKTKRLFAYTKPYCVWQLQIWIYRIVNMLKHREAISY